MVEACSHRALWQLSTDAAAAHDQRWTAESMAALPLGGLWVFDLGWFSCLWFDDCPDQQQFLVTRMRAQTASRTVQVLSQGPDDRDEIIPVGQYRSNPCKQPLRLVSVLWQGVWYRDRTNVLDPQVLSARQVCEPSRRRWRIEAACALTTRVLAVAYWWTGATHAVHWPIYAPLSVSAVLLTSCPQVAQAWGEPLERSSVARVLRALYHDGLAVPRGEYEALILFLTEHATRLGLVTRRRKRHRACPHLGSLMWGAP